MNFASDNVFGVHPRIIEALAAANAGTAVSYGADDWTRRAEERLSEVFEREVRAYLVVTGTAANALALSAMAPPYGAILCHADAHIMVDECGAPELFTGGAKLIGLAEPGGKITARAIESTLDGFIGVSMMPSPRRSPSPRRASSAPSMRQARSRPFRNSPAAVTCGFTWMARGLPMPS
jgi:threonine aldolase